MRGISIRTLPFILCAVFAAPAFAGWEYPGEYMGEGYYMDNGARFIMSARGGAAYGTGKIENNLGSITPEYCVNANGATVVCGENDTESLGYGDLGTLGAANNLSQFSFAAGASIGFTVPYKPQWRMELGWDHIAETDYNAYPLFEGELELTSGVSIPEFAGAVQSTVTTDIISAMAFYDFYDGISKPLNTFIPYIGAGIGYARSKTVSNLSDPYDTLSGDVDMRNFGSESGYGDILNFYRAETETGNFSVLGALGASYGITETLFLDFGVRVMYVPKIKWTLVNEDDTRRRDLFSAKNVIYGTATLGIRFEF